MATDRDGYEIKLDLADMHKFEVWKDGRHIDGFVFFGTAKRKIKRWIRAQEKVDRYNEEG